MLDIHGTSRLFCIYMLKCPSTRLYMLDSSMWKLHSILGDWKTVLWLYSEKKWLYSKLYSEVKWSVLGINIAQAPSHVLSPTTSCLVNGGGKEWLRSACSTTPISARQLRDGAIALLSRSRALARRGESTPREFIPTETPENKNGYI